MASREIWTKKTILLALHVCVAAITTVLFWNYPPAVGRTPWVVVPWAAYLVTSLVLAVLPPSLYSRRRFDFVFLTVEGLLIGTMLAAYFRSETWIFYPLLLVAVLLAALARQLSWAVLMAAAVAATHLLLSAGEDGRDPGVLILQTVLILVASGVIGFLAEELTREEASSRLLDNALEISTLLAGALESHEVYERATELLARLFRAGRVAVVLLRPETGSAEVVAAIDRGQQVPAMAIDLDRYPEIQTALERGSPVVIERADTHPDLAGVRPVLPQRARSSSILVTPIIQEHKPRGVIFVRLEGGGRSFTEHEIRLCRFMADAAGRALQRADQFAEVAEAARRDSLTGLFNVRVFHRRLAEEVDRSDRAGSRLSLLMVDLDYLKHVNDTYGHLAGDAVIREVGRILAAHVRTIDTVARYGGEEFALLLTETGSDRAHVVAERLRVRVEHADFGEVREPVTISVGFATYPDDATTPTELLHKADQALYASKNGGRNRTTSYRQLERRDEVREPGPPASEEPGRAAEDAMTTTLRDALAGLQSRRDTGRQIDIVSSLASVMQAKDPMAFDQLRTIATLADLFLAHLPLAESHRRTIRVACLVRDIGKLAISDELLQKKDFLTREEYRRVRQHPEIGARIVEPLPGFEGVVPLVLHHHERWDGKGYPDGLRGEEIPYGARVVGLLDAFHAMARRRPYAERSRGLRYACKEIRRNAGTQFDPELADRFLFVLEGNRDIVATLVTEVEEPERPAAGPTAASIPVGNAGEGAAATD